MSSNIIYCASIFPLIYSFVFLSSLETLADRLNASISVALISISYNVQNIKQESRTLQDEVSQEVIRD